ncbi:MAG TPA: hypothetical protein VN514_09985 [Ignavibacteria bacterium]|nr:hypothetical protein [Ignavibacteria bacterium]
MNKDYYILMFDDEIIRGKVIGNSTREITVSTEEGVISVKKDDIIVISEYYPKKIDKESSSISKPVWNIGGGIVFPSGNTHFRGNHNTKTSGDYQKGFTICAGVVIPSKRYIGFKGEFDFSHIPNGDNYYTTGYSSSYSYTSYQKGGTINEITFRGGICAGNFIPQDRIIVDVSLNAGIGIMFKDESTFYETETGSYSYTNEFYTGAFSQFTLSIGMSLSFKIRLIKRIGVFFEPQANIYSIANTPFQTNLKAGVIF